jgi:hypothetical protein
MVKVRFERSSNGGDKVGRRAKSQVKFCYVLTTDLYSTV